MMTEQDVARALDCDVALIRTIVNAWADQTLTTAPGWVGKRHGSLASIKLAMAHSLHLHAGLALWDAALVSSGCWQISSSVLKILNFEPPRHADVGVPKEGGDAHFDPFMLFAPHATESTPVAALDEYIEIADGRRVYWRKPRSNAYTLACELHRLSEVSRREDTRSFQGKYLELLSRLREPTDYVSEWIGTVAGGRFRPAPNRFSGRAPPMRQGPGGGEDRQTHADSYVSKVSVNVSLAARLMKRRALGLAVTDPLAKEAPANAEGRTTR
ncbi:hypothetical protein FQ775_07430 [Nitratireductor mangrovi]|uniref:Uncharacterized protein n=2 Tax=Nitratireductor mangrovi TaxID=2599600 RepID=A0A5B8KXB2_9HYPH|nr:hypothetical protein FQ775_07430 [Nitratireductor mangrovi]